MAAVTAQSAIATGSGSSRLPAVPKNAVRSSSSEKPAGAWTPEQVIDMLIAGMEQGDFYIICPDNEVTRAIDNRRMLWAAQDIIENRPPLSRWHPDFKAAFAQFTKGENRA